MKDVSEQNLVDCEQNSGASLTLQIIKVHFDGFADFCLHAQKASGLLSTPLFRGFCRTANIENPMNEFRVLDVDAGRWKEDLAFITRYLMGAQSTRPTEAMVRNGGLLVSRLVSARMKLKPPLKIDG